MKFGSLFAGIGGFDLGLERAGMECAWQVEIDPVCQRVLAKHWPNVTRLGDIHNAGRNSLESVDLIRGGFPCQPFSEAGDMRGAEDDRNLWPEMLRVIKELRPAWVIGENSNNIGNIYLDTIYADLEGASYQVRTVDIPACAVGADHIRERTWILAYADPHRFEEASTTKTTTHHQERDTAASRREWPPELREAVAGGEVFRARLSERGTEPAVGRVANGIPGWMDRLEQLGNALDPYIPELIGRAILAQL